MSRNSWSPSPGRISLSGRFIPVVACLALSVVMALAGLITPQTVRADWDVNPGDNIQAAIDAAAAAGIYHELITLKDGVLVEGAGSNATTIDGDTNGDGTGSIDQDPLLTADFHLQAGSPCIDAGSNSAPWIPATDFEGDARILDGNNDGVATADTTVTIENLPPTAGAITAPIAPVRARTAINVSTPFTDPGIQDVHTAVWDWGDGGTSPGTVTGSNGSGSVSGSHPYTAAGLYTVMLTVTDDDGGSAQAQFQYVVVYDPTAGSLTGAGWFNSPAGAYAAQPSLTGKAVFSLSAAYASRGATKPSGAVLFVLPQARFTFSSTGLDWLVAGPSKAYVRGSGTINGRGSYRFIVSCIDTKGAGGADKFRIKIWDKTTGNVVYDSQMGAADDADPSTRIGGGSIVIRTTHTP